MHSLRNIFLFIALAFPALFYITCTHEPTKPVEPPPPSIADTTTHNWRFEIDTLGGKNSGANDVIAFNEKDAWVTGNFYVYKDSTQTGSRTLYNIAHWDGVRWTLMMIPNPCKGEAGAIFGLDKNNIVFESYGLHVYDRIYEHAITIPPNTIKHGINAIWAINSQEFYMVGPEGEFLKWDGKLIGSFTTINSNTDIDLTDIYGDNDTLFICGITPAWDRSIMLKFSNGKLSEIDGEGFFQAFGIWYSVKDSGVLAVAGSKNRILRNGKWREIDSSRQFKPYMQCVRGTGLNNIWWGGHFLSFIHYNGSTFKQIEQLYGNGILTKIFVSDKYLFAVGYQVIDKDGWPHGVVVRGYRVE